MGQFIIVVNVKEVIEINIQLSRICPSPYFLSLYSWLCHSNTNIIDLVLDLELDGVHWCW